MHYSKYSTSLVVCSFLLVFLPLFAPSGRCADKPILQLDTGGHMAVITNLAFVGDGRHLVSASHDKTVRVWDRARRKTIRTIRGESGSGSDGRIDFMALSPDGRWLVTAGKFPGLVTRNAIRIFDYATGKLRALFLLHKKPITALSFSKDGSRLVSADSDGQVFIWTIEEDPGGSLSTVIRSRLFSKRSVHQPVYALGISIDNERVFLAIGRNGLGVWDLHENRYESLDHLGDQIISLAVSPNGDHFATGGLDGEIFLRDARTGDQDFTFRPQTNAVGALTFSPDGRFLLSGSGPSTDDRDALRRFRLRAKARDFSHSDVRGERQVLARDKGLTSNRYDCHVWDVVTGERTASYRAHDNVVYAVAISPDGRWAATAGGTEKEIHVWEITAIDPSSIETNVLRGVGRSIRTVGFTDNGTILGFRGQGSSALSATFRVPSKKKGLVGPRENDALKIAPRGLSFSELLNRLSHSKRIGQERIPHYRLREYPPTTALVGEDRKMIFVGQLDGKILKLKPDEIFEGFQERNEKLFKGHFSEVYALSMSPNGELLASGGHDRTVRLWNPNSGELIVSILYSSNSEWVMWTPQGYYWSSHGGDRMIGWQINQGPDKEARYITASQLKDHLRASGLIRRAIILRSAAKAVEEQRADDPGLNELLKKRTPNFAVTSPAPNAVLSRARAEVSLKFEHNDVPIKSISIEVRINNRNVSFLRQKGFSPQTTDAQTQHKITVPLQNGENEILIRAKSEWGQDTQRIWLTNDGAGELDKKGSLYLISVGVDKYPLFPGNDLKYAGKDAKIFSELVQRNVGKLYRQVKSHLLTHSAEHKPTAENIRTAFDSIKTANDNDTVVVFISGHGKMVDDEDYLFLATDSKQNDGRWDPSSVISWGDLASALRMARGRRLLFVDTCQSGGAYNHRLEYEVTDAGVLALSATDNDTPAVENETLRHGVFTYALRNGLSAATTTDSGITEIKNADSNQDGNITIYELNTYVSDTVKRLTNNAQRPAINARTFTDFLFAKP